MNRDQVKGWLGQLKGNAKIIQGELTDDPDRRAEGSLDRAFGRLRQAYGDTRADLRRAIDRLRY